MSPNPVVNDEDSEQSRFTREKRATSTPGNDSSVFHTNRCCSLILRSPSHAAVRAAGSVVWQELTCAASSGTNCWPLLLTVASFAIHRSPAPMKSEGVGVHGQGRCCPSGHRRVLRCHHQGVVAHQTTSVGLLLDTDSESSLRRTPHRRAHECQTR